MKLSPRTTQVLFAAATACSLLPAVEALSAERPVVSVVSVESEQVSPTLMVTGSVQSRHDSSVSAGIAGSLTWVAEPGTEVAKGESVAQLDARPFELAVRELEARLNKKHIEIRRLEQDLERYRRLQEQQSISAREVDSLEADLGMARSDAQLLEVEIDRARQDLARTRIVAPFDGMVTRRFQQQGESVSATQPVAQLVSTRALEVRFHGPLVHSALPASVGALRVHWSSGSVEMAVRATVPVSDGQSQSFLGYLDIPESMVSQFRIGQLISVAVPTALPAEQFIVPRDALVLGDQQIRVFVLDEEGRARAIPVTVGAGHGDYVAVEGSLAAGQQVIVRGAESIRSGDRVTVLLPESYPVTTLNS